MMHHRSNQKRWLCNLIVKLAQPETRSNRRDAKVLLRGRGSDLSGGTCNKAKGGLNQIHFKRLGSAAMVTAPFAVLHAMQRIIHDILVMLQFT